MGVLAAQERTMPRALRVSTGSRMPSSQSLALARPLVAAIAVGGQWCRAMTFEVGGGQVVKSKVDFQREQVA